MFATVDTLQLWVPMDQPAIDQLRASEGTRIIRTDQSSGKCLSDFVIVGNILHDSWYSPVQVNPQQRYKLPNGHWFAPFDLSPWIAVQLSVPKVILGHSVAEYWNHRRASSVVLEGLQQLVNREIDPYSVLVRRADFCRTIRTPSQKIAASLLRYMSYKLTYPNRPNPRIYAETVMWHSRHESFKAYLKLPELLKRHGKPPESDLDRIAPVPKPGKPLMGLTCRPNRARNALTDAATGQVRFEVSLRAKALRSRLQAYGADPGHFDGVVLPSFLKAVDHDIGGQIMRDEMDKVLSTAEVSSSDEVLDRLSLVYRPATANKLYRFWEVLCSEGDRGARDHYPKKTYYRYKAQLKVARVGTVGNDVQLEMKRRQEDRKRQAELLHILDGYGEHMRVTMGDEWLEELQREAGLPIPDRRSA